MKSPQKVNAPFAERKQARENPLQEELEELADNGNLNCL